MVNIFVSAVFVGVYSMFLVYSISYYIWSISDFSGICWGLFHVPVMILLTKKLKPDHPYLTVAIQCLSCLLSAFPHSWVAIKSG